MEYSIAHQLGVQIGEKKVSDKLGEDGVALRTACVQMCRNEVKINFAADGMARRTAWEFKWIETKSISN